MGKAATYADSKAKVRNLLLEYLLDIAKDGAGSCATLATVRSLMHYKGVSAFLEPVLVELEREKRISIWREGKSGVVYLLQGEEDESAS